MLTDAPRPYTLPQSAKIDNLIPINDSNVAKDTPKQKENEPMHVKEGKMKKRADGRWEVSLTKNGHRIYAIHKNQAQCKKLFETRLADYYKCQKSGEKFRKGERLVLHALIDKWYDIKSHT